MPNCSDPCHLWQAALKGSRKHPVRNLLLVQIAGKTMVNRDKPELAESED